LGWWRCWRRGLLVRGGWLLIPFFLAMVVGENSEEGLGGHG
jgi:hypothetical protein